MYPDQISHYRFHQFLYGGTFTLVTDHHLLCKIFGDKQGIPTLATARMQRWSLILSAYNYTIEYVSGTSNHYDDCMSRLPLPGQPIDSAENVHVFVQAEELPVTASQIAKESLKDQQLLLL